jgi:F-type H+-transporting ATPase subunit b
LKFFLRKYRINSPFLRFAMLAALAAGVTAGVTNLMAQTPGTAPQPVESHGVETQPGAPKAGMPGEQNNPEEEQIIGFLHSPAVQSLARFLHLSLSTTDTIFLDLNYLIIFAAIGIPLARFMPKVLHKRSITLRHNLESARTMTEEATARLNSVEAQLARLGEEIEKFRTEIEAELKNDEARIKGSLEEESARIVAAAEQEISMAAVQAQRGLRKFAAELAVDQAAKQIELSPEMDQALIAEFAASAATGSHNGSAGGQH